MSSECDASLTGCEKLPHGAMQPVKAAELAVDVAPFSSGNSSVGLHGDLRLIGSPAPAAALSPVTPTALSPCVPPLRLKTLMLQTMSMP